MRCAKASKSGLALFACLAFVGMGAAVAHAQDYRGKVQGLITDSSDAAVAGAAVTLRNSQTGVVTSRISSEIGKYLFDYVEPGEYTIIAERPGFSKAVQENVS